MKIIYVGNAPVSSKSAGCVHVIKMCQNLAKIGNEVILVVPDEIDENQGTTIDTFDDYGIEKNFTIVNKILIFPHLLENYTQERSHWSSE